MQSFVNHSQQGNIMELDAVIGLFTMANNAIELHASDGEKERSNYSQKFLKG